MGATPFFKKMLPVPPSDGKPGDKRELELFTHGGKVWFRMGPLNEENAGSDLYTVEVPPQALEALRESLQLLPDWTRE